MPRTEAKAGTTAPPFHPNCRCVIVPYFGDDDDTRAMREPVTGKSKSIENMTFKEWKEKYIKPAPLNSIRTPMIKCQKKWQMNFSTAIHHSLQEACMAMVLHMLHLHTERSLGSMRQAMGHGRMAVL